MKNWKSILLLLLVFSAGLAAGVAGTRALARQRLTTLETQPERLRKLVERGLERRLHLTAEQQTKVQAILADTSLRLDGLRGKYQPEMAAILTDTSNRINALLTPEQQKRFEEMRLRRSLLRTGQPALQP